MIEHPEIGWVERTGYPSWMQVRDLDGEEDDEVYDDDDEEE
jgi:hypothetical protein